jgi:hypothetical protein
MVKGGQASRIGIANAALQQEFYLIEELGDMWQAFPASL